MSEEAQRPKIKLKVREKSEEPLPEVAADKTEQPSAEDQPQKKESALKLRTTDEPKDSTDSLSDEENVGDILEHAYGATMEKERKSRRNKKTLSFIPNILGALAIFALTLGYSHLYERRPWVEPIQWYLPFLLSSITAFYTLSQGVKIFNRSRSILMLAVGVTIAAGICYWNVLMLQTTASITQHDPADPDADFDDLNEMIRIYGVNAAKGTAQSIDQYASASVNDYIQFFRRIPRSEWKSLFKEHLTPDEFAGISITNIDSRLPLVAERIIEKRQEMVSEFKDQVLETPNISTRIQSWAVKPYTFLFDQL